MSKPNDEQNFLIEITPPLYNRLQNEIGDAFTDNIVLHYSPYWRMMDETETEEPTND